MFLFGGAMSIGLCLWQTGAASWLAVHWLTLFEGAHWLVFVIGMSAFVLVITNVIMNVAAIAITYASGQFTPKEFFKAGIPASLILLVVLAGFVWVIWPMMGMPVLIS